MLLLVCVWLYHIQMSERNYHQTFKRSQPDIGPSLSNPVQMPTCGSWRSTNGTWLWETNDIMRHCLVLWLSILLCPRLRLRLVWLEFASFQGSGSKPRSLIVWEKCALCHRISLFQTPYVQTPHYYMTYFQKNVLFPKISFLKTLFYKYFKSQQVIFWYKTLFRFCQILQFM